MSMLEVKQSKVDEKAEHNLTCLAAGAKAAADPARASSAKTFMLILYCPNLGMKCRILFVEFHGKTQLLYQYTHAKMV